MNLPCFETDQEGVSRLGFCPSTTTRRDATRRSSTSSCPAAGFSRVALGWATVGSFTGTSPSALPRPSNVPQPSIPLPRQLVCLVLSQALAHSLPACLRLPPTPRDRSADATSSRRLRRPRPRWATSRRRPCRRHRRRSPSATWTTSL
jgi:hypothetical protein